MKTPRLPTRDRRENRFEREEKLGNPPETIPGKTLRDREPAEQRKFNRAALKASAIDMTIALRAAALPAPVATPVRTPVDTEFSLFAPTAESVSVAGSFNNWDPTSTPLHREERGVWSLAMSMKPGSYEYRFVVDGNWQEDPMACDSVENPYGSRNSIKRVG